MGDWDSLEAEAKSSSVPRGGRCGVSLMMEIITEENGADAAASVLRTMANVRLTTTSIHKALESRVEADYLPSVYTIQRHRKGACQCKRERP